MALGFFLSGSAHAFKGKPKIALVASTTASGASGCRFTDVQAKLLGSGQFDTVDIFDAQVAISSLATLLDYDACLCWTNTKPVDNVLWGDTMADYVEAGGGVVVAGMAISSSKPGFNLAGRWEEGYEVVVPKSGMVRSGYIGDIGAWGHG